MKKLYIIAIAVLAVLASCKDDDNENKGNGGNGTDRDVNAWIYGKMANWYLWNDRIPSGPDYSLDYDKFFVSMLTKDDGYDSGNGHRYYSYIDRMPKGTRSLSDTRETTQGLHIQLVRYVSSGSGSSGDLVMAHVMNVKPGSPADKAGITRGDRIYSIGGTEMTISNYTSLYPKIISDEYGDGRPQATQVKWYEQMSLTSSGPVTLSPEAMDKNPVWFCKKIDASTGYLYYDSFNYGGSGHPYDDYMKKVIKEELQGIDNLVLDLRYNGGGYLTCCQLLSSIIAPADRAGAPFMTRKYNALHPDETDNFLSVSEMQDPKFGNTEAGVCLDLATVYVITTEASASASETLIHGLKGADVKVIQIGTDTHGKNVGMSGFLSKNEGRNFKDYDYEMWPVTFAIRNAKNQSYTTDGLPTDFECDDSESDLFSRLYQLGNTSEACLGAALYHIANGSFSGYTPAGYSPGSRAADAGTVALHSTFIDRGLKHWEEE